MRKLRFWNAKGIRNGGRERKESEKVDAS